MTPEAFAAERRERLKVADEALVETVSDGLNAYGAGEDDWSDEIVAAAAQVWLENFQAEAPGANYQAAMRRFREKTADVLAHTGQPEGESDSAQVDRVTRWLSTYAVNEGTVSGAAARGIRYKRWVTMEDAHVRTSHHALDGAVRPIGGTFDVAGTKLAYPGEPKGPLEVWINCVVGSTEIGWVGQEVLAATRRKHCGAFVEIVTRDGHRLTTTPNHPVLTPIGYVPAGQLSPGDQVMASPRAIAPEVGDVPTSAEQFYGAMREAGVHERIRGGAVDFHGDIAESEVEIVWADCNLPLEVGGETGEEFFVGTQGREVALVGTSLADSTVPDFTGPATSGTRFTQGDIRGEGIGSSLFGREASHSDSVGLAAAAQGEAECSYPPLNGSAIDADFPRHLENALASGMTASDVVEVNLTSGVRHVYNFHTSENYYTGNGIALHNCRCVIMPASREGETMSANTFAMAESDVPDEQNVNPDGTPYTGALVVLVPADDDPVVAASSEPAHLTFVWMGEQADIDESAQAAIAGEVRSYAAALDGPVVVPVMRRGTLGDDDADVAFLERTDALVSLRDGLMESSPNLASAHDAAKQFPEWTPHVTLGYPERPAQSEYDADEVTFDRISLWLGGEHYDYPMGGTVTAAADEPVDKAVDEDDMLSEEEVEEDATPEDDIDEIPVHGVLAPEGIETGDGRGFREGSLSTRPLPIPLRYEIVGSHGGNQTSEVVTVGRIDEAWRDESTGMWRFRGAVITSKPYADAAIQGLVDRSGTGVSIDADAMSVDMDSLSEDAMAKAEAEGRNPTQWFSSARVAGLTIVPIPAFHEAYIGLGPDFVEDMSDEEIAAAAAILADCGCGDHEAYEEAIAENPELEVPFRDVSTDERKRLADEGKAMDDGSYPIANVEDLKNAIQAVGRAKNPDKVKAHIKKRAKALGQEKLIPEDWAVVTVSLAEAMEQGLYGDGVDAPRFEEFAPGTHDGPGWITHPRATARIRRYWTRGEGAAKIKWGVPGDFNRCRRQLVKYVQNPEWLAGLCSNMHKEAIGVWPGQEAAARTVTASGAEPAPILTLVASAESARAYPSEWFADPKFTQITPMHIDRETGRVYGHLAAWGVCHIGIAGVCREAPHSASGYAYYLRGVVDTDAGEQRVASLTAGIGHADPRMRAAAATAHYDDIDAVWAYVNVGEDRFGIWYSGVLNPYASDEMIDKVRSIGAVSGDWRRIGAGLELVAAVSVNGPGYPIMSLAADGGVQESLVAAGMVMPEASQFETDSEANEKFLARAVVRAMEMVEDKKRAEQVRTRALALRKSEARERLGRI